VTAPGRAWTDDDVSYRGVVGHANSPQQAVDDHR
jgi:hypothetical protein